MPYPTQHENFYKNRIVQLQQKLQQLTEMYEYRLNEAEGIPPIRVPIPVHGPIDVPPIPEFGPQVLNDFERVRGRGAHTFLTQAQAALQFARLLESFSQYTPVEMLRIIRNASPEFRAYILEHYGTVVEVGATTWQSGRTWQRLAPDGTAWTWVPGTNWGENGRWQPLNKPGSMTAFGRIGPDGQIIPPGIGGLPNTHEPIRSPMLNNQWYQSRR